MELFEIIFLFFTIIYIPLFWRLASNRLWFNEINQWKISRSGRQTIPPMTRAVVFFLALDLIFITFSFFGFLLIVSHIYVWKRFSINIDSNIKKQDENIQIACKINSILCGLVFIPIFSGDFFNPLFASLIFFIWDIPLLYLVFKKFIGEKQGEKFQKQYIAQTSNIETTTQVRQPINGDAITTAALQNICPKCHHNLPTNKSTCGFCGYIALDYSEYMGTLKSNESPSSEPQTTISSNLGSDEPKTVIPKK
jgi:hypothetical protein